MPSLKQLQLMYHSQKRACQVPIECHGVLFLGSGLAPLLGAALPRRLAGPSVQSDVVPQLRKLSPVLLEDTEFYLVTTLECLWTLAERSVDGWRLFGRVPRYVSLQVDQHPCTESQPTTPKTYCRTKGES